MRHVINGTDEEQIGIVPAAWAGNFSLSLVPDEVGLHTEEAIAFLLAVLDVEGGAPGLGKSWCPLGHTLVAVVADGVEHWSLDLCDLGGHVLISLQSWHAFIVAISVLDVVNLPTTPKVNIFSLEAKGAWITVARHDASVGGDTDEEALIVNVVGDLLESVRELVQIGVEEAKLVSGACLPAIIDNDILETEVLETAADEEVNLSLDTIS
jgi:hypothetical protein